METSQFILDGHGNDLKAAKMDDGDEAMQEFIDNITAFQACFDSSCLLPFI